MLKHQISCALISWKECEFRHENKKYKDTERKKESKMLCDNLYNHYVYLATFKFKNVL